MMKARQLSGLANAPSLISKNANYRNALRFADENLRNELQGYEQANAETVRRVEAERQRQTEIQQRRYAEAERRRVQIIETEILRLKAKRKKTFIFAIILFFVCWPICIVLLIYDFKLKGKINDQMENMNRKSATPNAAQHITNSPMNEAYATSYQNHPASNTAYAALPQAQLPTTCAVCGTPLRPGVSFCTGCGARAD
jgi:hypothetical protein